MAVYAASHHGLITAALIPNSVDLHLDNGRVFDASVPLLVADHRSLLRTAGNQIRSAFAFSAMQTQREDESVFGSVPHTPPTTEPSGADLWAARAVVYLIAQSVALDLMTPTWRIPPEFRRSFAILELDFTMDATGLHDEEIRWGHFGGLTRYLNLILFLSYCLDGIDPAEASKTTTRGYGLAGTMSQYTSDQAPSASPVTDEAGYGAGSGRRRRPSPWAGAPDEDEPAGWIAPDGPPEPRITVASQASEMGPIDDFVADACSTGDRAMILAGELYTSYARWCLDHGYLAHSQRKFGLELRARGYERKRRGKGRHWWIGVECRP